MNEYNNLKLLEVRMIPNSILNRSAVVFNAWDCERLRATKSLVLDYVIATNKMFMVDDFAFKRTNGQLVMIILMHI